MANVKGLFFVTREKHPSLFRTKYRKFYLASEWDLLCLNIGSGGVAGGDDALISKVVSFCGDPEHEKPNGYFVIHKHLKGKKDKPNKKFPRRFYGNINSNLAEQAAIHHSQESGECFIIAQVVNEVSYGKSRVGKWHCADCGLRNNKKMKKCKRCGKDKTND